MLALSLAACGTAREAPPPVGCDFGEVEHECMVGEDLDGDGVVAEACTAADRSHAILQDDAYGNDLDAHDYAYAGGFLGDIDGDGRDEVTLAKPGNVGESYHGTRAYLSEPLLRQVFLSSSFCAEGGNLGQDDARAVVHTTDGVVTTWTDYGTPIEPLASIGVAEFLTAVDLGDLDGDGRPEVGALDYLQGKGGALAIHSGASILGGGDLGFSDASGWIMSEIADLRPYRAVANVGDVDHDGVPDVLLWGGGVTSVHSGSLAARGLLHDDQRIATLPDAAPALGGPSDFDGDGVSDVVVRVGESANYASTAIARIWSGASLPDEATEGSHDLGVSGTGRYCAAWMPCPLWALDDVDGDGLQDLLIHEGAETTAVVLASQLAGDMAVEDAHFRIQGLSLGGDALTSRPSGSPGGDRGILLYGMGIPEAGGDFGWDYRMIARETIAAGGVAESLDAVSSYAVYANATDRNVQTVRAGDVDGDGGLDFLAILSGDEVAELAAPEDVGKVVGVFTLE